MKEIQERKIEIRQSLEKNQDLNLDEVKVELEKLEAEEIEIRSKQEIANKINANEILSNDVTSREKQEERKMENMFETVEYRSAFRNYVLKGESLPVEMRSTTTAEAGAVIPQNVLNRVIDKLTANGMILDLVTRTAYQGGVSIPVGSVKPTASWVAEGAGSAKQKKAIGHIVFAYNKLRCAVAVSLEMNTMSLSAFENAIVNNISEAMTVALEQAIVSGDGAGKPKGILTETPAAEVTAAKIEYKTLTKAEAALPIEHENNAVWVMTKKTFMNFIEMVDTQGQPIARVNYGVSGQPERTLLGRKVVLCNYLNSFEAAAAGDTFAFLFDFSNYILNTNFQIAIKKYEDNETDDIVTKAILVADGKVVDASSLVVLKKA